MDDLYDAIETITLENEFQGPLRPVVNWDVPTEQELEDWKQKKRSAADSSNSAPFSMEWCLEHEVGLYLFSAFLKDVAKDYCRINFCEDVYRFKKSTDRKALRRARYIVKEYLSPPIVDPKTNKKNLPPVVDIQETDLARIAPASLPVSREQLKTALENNIHYPECTECIVGLEGDYRVRLVDRVKALGGASSRLLMDLSGSLQEEANEGKDRAEAVAEILKPEFFDAAECIVLESLKRDHWDAFLESTEYKKLLNFLWYEDRTVTLDDFFPMRVLGKGGFGLVKACKKGSSGKLYAMKVMNKRRIKMKKSEQLIINERRALAAVESKFIVNLKYSFQTKDDIYLILEMMTGGDLGYHLGKHGHFTKDQCLYFAARIMLGLQALHDKGYVFRDLKPENCLLAEDGRVKITDLGLATKITPKLHGAAGTRGYWAPEMLRRDANGKRMPYGHAVDWFSYGCCVAEFISGRNPFRSEAALRFGREQGKQSKEKQMDCATLEMTPEFSTDEFEQDAADLLLKLLEKDEKKRLGYNGCNEIMKHPWFESVHWDLVLSDKDTPKFVPPPKEVHSKSQSEIGAHEKASQDTVLTEADEKYYTDWDWTHPRVISSEILEFLICERTNGEPLVPLRQQASCCCEIL